ncbi:MAG: hypothetical protein ACR2IF_18470 [Terriglobales bacterium]
MSRALTVLALLAIAAITLSPVWIVAFPPLLDYPNHLASNYVLSHLHDASLPFHNWYGAKWGLYPYLAMEAALHLLQWILPIELAGRVLLSLALLALPLATWFFLRQINPGENSVALWALVATHNIFFLLAYLNFYISISVCFLALGIWLKWLARPRPLLWIAGVCAFTALYFSHLVAFALAGIGATSYCLIALVWRGSETRATSIRNLLLTWAMFLPGALCYLYSARVIEKQRAGFVFLGFADKLDGLRGVMHGYSERLDWWTLALFAAWFVLVWIRNRDFQWNLRWLAVAVVLFALYWAMPWAYGDGSDLDVRVLPILFGVLLATVRPGRRGWWLAPLVLALFFLRVGNVAENYRAYQPELKGLAGSFNATPDNVRVLPIIQADPDTDGLHHPFAHFWSYGVIRRHWFSPYLFELRGLNPLRVVYQTYTLDGFWDLDYKETPDWNAIRDDYDYVWCYNAPQYHAALAKIGELVYSDRKLRLYRIIPAQP